jgi:hypothetical protein
MTYIQSTVTSQNRAGEKNLDIVMKKPGTRCVCPIPVHHSTRTTLIV